MTRRRYTLVAFGLLGTVGTVVAGLLAFAPATLGGLRSPLTRASDLVDPLWVGAAVGLVGLMAAWHVGQGDRDGATFDGSTPPESVTAEETPLVGDHLDRRYEAALADESGAMDAMVDRLRTTAVTTYALAAEVPRERAERAVTAGEWTDDAVAAALLAPEATQPLLARLRLWLDPESERERRLRRAVAAIEGLREADRR